MKIAVFASEIYPYAKTGGLADVISSLPNELIKKKPIEQIDIYIPYYREISRQKLDIQKIPLDYIIQIGSKNFKGTSYRLNLNLSNYNIYFIDNYKLFRNRSDIYVKHEKDYHDNLTRFVFFCRGSLETVNYLSYKEKECFYDIFHCHDWQTALIPLFTETTRYFLNKMPLRVLTIHNMAFQGNFPRSKFQQLGIDKKYFDPAFLEFWGKINLLKAGIVFSDILTTVSPTYSNEIQTDEYGVGLGYLLKINRNKLFGVLNGVDYTIWNPEIDPNISANYSINDLSGKKECKSHLQRLFKLKEDESIPILSVVSRLTWQKGLDLLIKILSKIMREDIQFVLLGTGEKKLEFEFKKLGYQFPTKTGISLTFDDKLAHKIEAGADIFLMPSRYEPCGLNDKYSLRYGTVPIVNNTGGLADSVIDYSKDPENGTGFVFEKFNESLFEDAIYRALKVFQFKKEWLQLMKRCMKQDFSWTNAAEKYIKIFQQNLNVR